MIKTVFSVFTPRQVARSLGDLSIYYSCQFWKLATLNQTRDICFCTNLASQHRKLRRENIYIPFDQITQVGIILSHRSIPPFIRMPYSQPHNTSRRDYKACSLCYLLTLPGVLCSGLGLVLSWSRLSSMSQNRALAPATSLTDDLGQFHLQPELQFSLLAKELKHPEKNETNKALASRPTTSHRL